MKKSPLKRTGFGTRGGSLKRTPLAPRSKKTQKRYEEERIPFVKRILDERPLCQACPVFADADGKVMFHVKPSHDVHEIHSRGRTGGVFGDDWLKDENVLAVCRLCHNRITDNPAEAEKLGLAT